MSDNMPRVRVSHRMVIARRQELDRAGVPESALRQVPVTWPATGAIKRIKTDNVWVETTVDDEWVAAYRVVSQPTGLVVGEIRIFPVDDAWRDPQTQPGEWSGCLLGTGARVPPGGLTARLLRQVRIDGVVSDGRRVLSELARHGRVTSKTHPAKGHALVSHALHRAGIGGTLKLPSRHGRAGRPRLPAAEYERLAAEYTKQRLKGVRARDAYTYLARKFKLTESQARNRISRAREYGFLRHLPVRRRRG